MKLAHLEARRRQRGWAAVTDALHNGLAGFGLLVLAYMIVDGAKLIPAPAAQLSAAAFSRLTQEAPKSEVAVVDERDPQHQALATYLARRYRVASDATVDLVAEAHAVGQILDLDPLLILAVISVESRFNPIAESDYGAKGLMQVVPRFHQDKLSEHGGEPAVLDPRTNILVGAQILKEYIRRTGSMEAGLQLYAGAADDPVQGYSQKVFTEKQRLREALRRAARSGTAT
jgi:soluble lytic murein transglycosylase-like protein